MGHQYEFDWAEASKKECEDSKIMCFLLLFVMQYNKNTHSEGLGDMIEHTDLDTEIWTVTYLCAKH